MNYPFQKDPEITKIYVHKIFILALNTLWEGEEYDDLGKFIQP